MSNQELMLQSLSNLLENDETLKFPIYGTLLQKRKNWFGFFGLTDDYLLVALLDDYSKTIRWTTRIPLDIKQVNMKKCIVPKQYKIYIEFNEGDRCIIRVSEKVYGIKSQEANLPEFIKSIQKF